MIKNSMKFRVEWQGDAWFIVDPDNADIRVQIDQAVIDATVYSTKGRFVEGYILSVHGLDFDVARLLDRAALNQLGVAAQLRNMPPAPARPMRRVRLEAGGRINFQL
jgi:hypothetical protein